MNEQIIDYLHYLTIERGLSQNTRASYQRDLQQYLAFLQKQVTQWQQIDRVIVLSFCKVCKRRKILGNRDSDGFQFAKIPSIFASRTVDRS